MSGASVRRRLDRLEGRLPPREDRETALARAVHGRMTVEELRAYVSALRRVRAGEDPAGQDGAIFARARDLYEEVGGVRGNRSFLSKYAQQPTERR